MGLELLAILIIPFTFWLQASIGFGSALVALPFLVMFMPSSDAISLVLIFQFLNGLLILSNLKTIDWDAIKKLSIGIVAGCVIGTLIQAYLPHDAVMFFIGCFVLLYVFKRRIYPSLGEETVMKIPKSIVGSIGGFIQGGFGIGGPIFVVYFSEIIKDKLVLRATLIATFFICNFIRIVIYIPSGLLTHDVLILALYVMIPFLIAIYIGQKYHACIKDCVFRNLIDILLTISGISIIAKSIF